MNKQVDILRSKMSDVDDYGYPTKPDSKGRLRKIGVGTTRSLLVKGIGLALNTVGTLLWLGQRGRAHPPLRPGRFAPRRILVIRLDLIGDVVLSTTVVRALKRTYPEAEIDLLAIPASAKVLASDPDLHQILTYDPNIWRRPKALFGITNWRAALQLRRQMHRRHYDLAMSVSGPWAAILSVLSGAPRRIGFGKEGYFGFMTDSAPGAHWRTRQIKHEVDYCLELAQKAGAKIEPSDRVPHLTVVPQAQEEIQQLLQQEGITHERPIIACHINSNNGQSKRWPIPYWATLLDRLIREGNQVILTGAPNDLPNIEAVIQRMSERPHNLSGRTSLTGLAALFAETDLLITGDSGPMHIAAAMGTPLLAIHGPTDPNQSGPISPRATIIRSDIWCSPCYNATSSADCRFFTTACMKNISPTRLYETVQHVLHQDRSQAEAQTIIVPYLT